MSQDRLSDLAVLGIQRSIAIDIVKVINEFDSNVVGRRRKLALKYKITKFYYLKLNRV